MSDAFKQSHVAWNNRSIFCLSLFAIKKPAKVWGGLVYSCATPALENTEDKNETLDHFSWLQCFIRFLILIIKTSVCFSSIIYIS